MAAENTTIEVALGSRSYPIHIGEKLLDQLSALPMNIRGRQVLIVTDEQVGPLYLNTVLEQLSDLDCRSLVVPSGETAKQLTHFESILTALMQMQASRDASLIALGGGVVGDLTGFAAACYMRGIDFIQIPTTLLAQVDASVGGKTAINHPMGKNLIGAFHQPVQVIIDVASLESLPEREFRAGIAEIIKYGLIMSPEFIAQLEQQMPGLLAKDRAITAGIIAQCCRFKADIVARDENESGQRALLNFGHTFGHALETATGYSHFLHGEAVAIGCCLAARFSASLGLISQQDVDRIMHLIRSAGLPTDIPTDLPQAMQSQLTSQSLAELMRLDKKNLSGEYRFILLRALGDAFVDARVRPSDVVHFLDRMRSSP